MTCLGIFGAHRRPYSDCPSRQILAFLLLAFIGRRPSLPRGFRHQHPRLSRRRGRMKSESLGRRAEGAGERAACLLLPSPQCREGCHHTVRTRSATFSSSRLPRRPPQPRRALPCRPRALWLRGPVAPSLSGSASTPPPAQRASSWPAGIALRPRSKTNPREYGCSAALTSTSQVTRRPPSSARQPSPASTRGPYSPSRGKMKCPARGAPPDFEKPFHSPRVRLDPPPATSGQMIFTLGRAQVEGPGSWGGRKGGGSAELLGCSRAPLAARG